MNLRNCIGTTNIGFLKRVGLETTTWVWGPMWLPHPLPLHANGTYGEALSDSLIWSQAKKLYWDKRSVESYHIDTGSRRELWNLETSRERRMTLRNQMSRNSRKLLKRKSEMGHCNSPPPREENRVFLDTERKGWLCLPLLPNFYCLLIHWAQRPRPWQPGGLWSITSSLLGLDSDCKRRPTRATPTTWAVQLLSP